MPQPGAEDHRRTAPTRPHLNRATTTGGATCGREGNDHTTPCRAKTKATTCAPSRCQQITPNRRHRGRKPSCHTKSRKPCGPEGTRRPKTAGALSAHGGRPTQDTAAGKKQRAQESTEKQKQAHLRESCASEHLARPGARHDRASRWHCRAQDGRGHAAAKLKRARGYLKLRRCLTHSCSSRRPPYATSRGTGTPLPTGAPSSPILASSLEAA